MDRQRIEDWLRVDPEGLQDFIDGLRDYLPAIERDVARLRVARDDRDALGSLFRSLHNIKGDAALCRVALAVALVHPIETMLERVRRHEVPFTDLLSEMVLLVVDHLELAMNRLAAGHAFADLRVEPLVQGIEELAQLAPSEFDERLSSLIGLLASRRSLAGGGSDPAGEPTALRRQREDLSFFRSLARQLDGRSPRFAGRCERLARLVLQTNQAAGGGIDPAQLEAAVYMHDLGMMFLAEAAWLKPGRMTAEDKVALHRHPLQAAGLLSRMVGWAEAAEMVAQHHESPDGKGYPQGLPAAAICPGARLLAMVDAFDSVMLKHDHRGRKRSVLLAIAEINACDRQFAAEWIAPFNQVVRRLLDDR
ncbi:MAG: Cyclic di-GMP phosphodiesterase response regulator RpfG [Candidatus Accumulibacter adjunctus]|uniref:Cyclic di-GMP phosphodiesterase response regulator RpfG n=1 Tax=Candidatus Accumulibacter adjunctus TaxID=1454001 RepID=A0A011M732_9PROT|nr:MAG: Cyclic di-GMP phosphodiesterase response regulator RpfG [Candidatus Accumulibacter adjunctus]